MIPMETSDAPCVRVAIHVPIKKTFTYRVPKEFAPLAQVGCRVLAPFHRRMVIGYILEQTPETADRDLKEISDVLDITPVFTPGMVPLFSWMADYYLNPIGLIIKSAIPDDHFKTARLRKRGQEVLKGSLFQTGETDILEWINKNPDRKIPWPLKTIYPLKEKGLLHIEDRILPTGIINPYLLKFVMPETNIDLETALAFIGSDGAPKNETAFLEMIYRDGAVLLKDIRKTFSNGSYLVNKWVKRGVLKTLVLPISRNPDGISIHPPSHPHTLNEHQQQTFRSILTSLDKKSFSSFLLYGVTGSGKTEVYFRAVEHTINSGRQAILMAPEISLAVYLEGFFRANLGDRVAVYHSGLNKKERVYLWQQMAKGKFDVVIGARSALFAPFSRLGLIIVDEEHDPAYVQEGSVGATHYQARDTAVMRARMEGAVVILGSGTPSVQSFHNSTTGRYHLLSMPERVEKRSLPGMELVDMKKLKEESGREEIISSRLRAALHENLSEGNQAILFLNRRGFNRIHICRGCGKSITCPNCDVTLTYHLKDDRLACHYCGFQCKPTSRCPSCGGTALRAYGFGTEKLENEVKILFPDARTARIDGDIARKKGEISKVLKNFGRRETDILVGTQMITKGYDFPHVTLVGIISADLSLGFPDFRAGERTFHLISQVAGRAGRGDLKGKVIIQTHNPDHYVIQAALQHDFQAFYENEKALRKQLRYPPFSHLACLRVKGNNREKTEEAVKRLRMNTDAVLKKWSQRGKEIRVLGPVESPIARIKGKYRWQFLFKCGSSRLLRLLLTEVERLCANDLRSSGVSFLIDVDPYHML